MAAAATETATASGQLNVEDWPAGGSRSVECFEKLEQIGEGTYGQVYMAREKKTGDIVALKKIRMKNEDEGFPMTAIREIKILKKLHHQNVIKLKEIVSSPPGREGGDYQGKPDNDKCKGGNIYMVFEYMDHDLTGLCDRPGLRFSVPQIKCYMKQLLTGLHYCHLNQVLHRDIKGSNLLIDNEGNLKLADFGLARYFTNDSRVNLTNRVITLWYRPPELLLGATKYGPSVDLWSVGCIFAELLEGNAILRGKSEPDQLHRIYELCGTPDEVSWPGVSKTPWYQKFKPARQMKKRIREVFSHFDRQALDLLERLLVLDPAQRVSAKDALDAEYFWTDPLPCDPKSLPKYESSHEFQLKQKRQQHEDLAKRPKFLEHSRLPPIQQPLPPPQINNASHHHLQLPGGTISRHQSGGGVHFRPPPPSGNAAAGIGQYPPRGYCQDGGSYGSGQYPPRGQYPGIGGPRGYGTAPPPHPPPPPPPPGFGGCRGPNLNRNQQQYRG